MRVVFLALTIWLVSLPQFVRAQQLTVVADEWPPFSGESLPNRGISIDVITAVLTRAGYDVRAEILPWARIMSGSHEDEFDIIGSLFFDAEIAEYMTYGDPYYQTSVKFAQQTGTDHDVSSIDALGPYSIAVGDGFLYSEEFDRAADLNRVIVTTTLQGVQMVAHGRVDLTLDSEEVLQYALTEQAPDLTDAIEILPHVLEEHNIHMAVRNSLPNRDQIVADFNRVLREMREDGSLEALLSRHR